ncbi:hypothetical protein [Bradyrhizobium sp. PRIMUS42]|uniref:hypothetical protein n=1 Tax=Bradyrhizobium sp. PRIMUS42 TaxID=2908926 RepID=UPI001FF43ACC|nr:hypothetical protein [Bradyrhizobium sp. PRIMUS42]MCJ9729562.1 hypothetical protein [Bradyrhizobium sp. PRIMUS42]
MPSSVEDLQMLRLIKAFRTISDQDARRAVLLYVEEQAENQRVKSSQKRGQTDH